MAPVSEDLKNICTPAFCLYGEGLDLEFFPMTCSCSCRWWTSVGRKWMTGITGLALVLFLVIHLVGNLTLFASPEVFNSYAHFLETAGHGMLLKVSEVGLLAFFAVHIAASVRVTLSKAKARPTGYQVEASKGGPSKKTSSSLWMIISGSALLLFVILHVAHFKYGNTETVVVHGEEMRNIYKLVVSEFKQFPQVLLYVLFMGGLAMHLRHGVWSALQSVGAIKPRLLPAVYCGGAIFGVLLATGFLLLPLIIFFFFPTPI
jgi:succinate dehydrogenase / fumarate reductase cytochrome b subunit